MKTLIPALILALMGSFLSALYLSVVKTSKSVPNEIKLPGIHHGEIEHFESPS